MQGKTETTELGLQVELTPAEIEARGKYDASRTPEAVQRLVCFLLAVPGMKWDRIATTAGIAWETVAAIARSRPDAIREFKGRLAGNLSLVIEAATPGLLERAQEGKISPFEFKLLTETWALLAGEATSRHEVVTVSPELEDLRRLIAARPVQETGGEGGKKIGSGPNFDAAAAGPAALPAPAEPSLRPAADQVIEAEVVVANHQRKD